MPDQVPTTTSDISRQLPDRRNRSQGERASDSFAKANAILGTATGDHSGIDSKNPSPAQVSQNPVTGGPQVNTETGQTKPLYQDKFEAGSTDTRDLHPLVQNASVLRRVGEVLAGGPRYKTTYDDQGQATRTPVPLSTRQILLASVANVLGGAGQIASNLGNRMEGRAPQPIQPLPSQVAQQKQDQQSEEDYNREQTQKIRKAKIIEANLTAMVFAYAVGEE